MVRNKRVTFKFWVILRSVQVKTVHMKRLHLLETCKTFVLSHFSLLSIFYCSCQILNTAVNKTPSPDTPSATLYALFNEAHCARRHIFGNVVFFSKGGRLLSGVRALGAGRRPLYHPYVGSLLQSQPPWNASQRAPVLRCRPVVSIFSKKASWCTFSNLPAGTDACVPPTRPFP